MSDKQQPLDLWLKEEIAAVRHCGTVSATGLALLLAFRGQLEGLTDVSAPIKVILVIWAVSVGGAGAYQTNVVHGKSAGGFVVGLCKRAAQLGPLGFIILAIVLYEGL